MLFGKCTPYTPPPPLSLQEKLLTLNHFSFFLLFFFLHSGCRAKINRILVISADATDLQWVSPLDRAVTAQLLSGQEEASPVSPTPHPPGTSARHVRPGHFSPLPLICLT